MFWCFPNNKCEWSNLKSFVKHFNIESGENYSLIECLDIKDNTKPQPEILLKSQNDKYMVIERKAIVWPNDHLKKHSLLHIFMDCVISELASLFDDDVYVLKTKSSFLHGNKYQIIKLAKQISNRIKSNQKHIKQTGEIASRRPIPWRFHRLEKFDHDDDTPEKGVGVWVSDPWELDFPNEKEILRVRHGIKDQIKQVIKRTIPKFKNYLEYLKILILEIYSDSDYLTNELIEEIFNDIDLPSSINQVWLGEQVWLDDYNWEISYKLVRK